MSQVWTIKLTESTNICCIFDGVACTIKMNGLQSDNKRPITSEI